MQEPKRRDAGTGSVALSSRLRSALVGDCVIAMVGIGQAPAQLQDSSWFVSNQADALKLKLHT